MKRNKWDSLLATTLIFLLCAALTPMAIQYGDAGELVGNSHSLSLSHPPGFPLYHLIMHPFLRLLPGISGAFIATIIGQIILFSGLAVLARGKTFASVFVFLLLLISVPAVYIQIITPDVFALNMGLFAWLIAILGSKAQPKIKIFLAIIFYFLGLTNHPIFIFVLPCLFTLPLLQYKKESFLALVIGAILATSIYLSLLVFDTSSGSAWPIHRNFDGWLAHVLRKNYGTFQLSVSEAGATFLENLKYLFGQNIILILCGLFSAFLFKNKWKKYGITNALLLSLFLYLALFFSRANIPHSSFGVFLLDRFVSFAAFILFLVLLFGASQFKQMPLIFLFLLSMYQAVSTFTKFNFKDDFLLEDATINLFLQADKSEKQCRAILAYGDSEWGAFVYVKNRLFASSETKIIPMGLLLLPEYQIKLRSENFYFPEMPGTNDQVLDMEEQFIRPNLEKCNFYSISAVGVPEKMAITQLIVGRKLSLGKGAYLANDGADKLVFRSNVSNLNKLFFLSRAYLAVFVRYPILSAQEKINQKKYNEAEVLARVAMSLAPDANEPKKLYCEALRAQNKSIIDCQNI